jgi:hypothetical protein
VRFSLGTFDGHRADNADLTGQALDHRKPDALSAPTVEAVINCRVRPVLRRTSRQRAPITAYAKCR